jgi:hypothetical protein
LQVKNLVLAHENNISRLDNGLFLLCRQLC